VSDSSTEKYKKFPENGITIKKMGCPKAQPEELLAQPLPAKKTPFSTLEKSLRTFYQSTLSSRLKLFKTF
jgi:hypothetical protein